MANRIIQLTADTVKKNGLEVYRDISLTADINQANILKTYREVVPMAYLAANTVVAYIDQLDEDGNYVKKDELTDVFDLSGDNRCRYSYGQYVIFSKHENSNVLCANFGDLDLSINWKCQVSAPTDEGWKPSDMTADKYKIENYSQFTGDLTNVFLHGDASALTFVKSPFFIKAQYADTYYEEVYGDTIENYVQFLAAEGGRESEISAIITESSVQSVSDLREILTLMQNEGAVSSFYNWKELQHWNPYKLAKLVNVKAVFNSLHNIFTWIPGERILNPEFGSNLRKLLYQGITEFTSEGILSEIRRCISEYEPRVSIQKILNASNVNDTENNTIQIDIIFTIPTLTEEQFIYSYKYNQYAEE